MSDFQTWWTREGGEMLPGPNEDIKEFSRRLAQIAWSNGEYVEREACAKVCENRPTGIAFDNGRACATAIRARGNT